MALPVGRPPAYSDPEEMQVKISEYIDKCIAEKERPIITGLCHHLGFESRQSFYDYELKPNFAYTVKRARLLIEMEYEKRVGEGAGFIFALKNFGWTDKTEVDNTHNFPQGIDITFTKPGA